MHNNGRQLPISPPECSRQDTEGESAAPANETGESPASENAAASGNCCCLCSASQRATKTVGQRMRTPGFGRRRLRMLESSPGIGVPQRHVCVKKRRCCIAGWNTRPHVVHRLSCRDRRPRTQRCSPVSARCKTKYLRARGSRRHRKDVLPEGNRRKGLNRRGAIDRSPQHLGRSKVIHARGRISDIERHCQILFLH